MKDTYVKIEEVSSIAMVDHGGNEICKVRFIVHSEYVDKKLGTKAHRGISAILREWTGQLHEKLKESTRTKGGRS